LPGTSVVTLWAQSAIDVHLAVVDDLAIDVSGSDGRLTRKEND